MYRFVADIFNDSAMMLDVLSPALGKGPRVGCLSAASCLRALCGVAAGSSKASLSKHFATQGNLGELNAVSWTGAVVWFVVLMICLERLESGDHHLSYWHGGGLTCCFTYQDAEGDVDLSDDPAGHSSLHKLSRSPLGQSEDLE